MDALKSANLTIRVLLQFYPSQGQVRRRPLVGVCDPAQAVRW
jgi:hypothetical protein